MCVMSSLLSQIFNKDKYIYICCCCCARRMRVRVDIVFPSNFILKSFYLPRFILSLLFALCVTHIGYLSHRQHLPKCCVPQQQQQQKKKATKNSLRSSFPRNRVANFLFFHPPALRPCVSASNLCVCEISCFFLSGYNKEACYVY